MSFSFDIKNSLDLFNAFSNTVDDYIDDPLSSGKAVVCAMFAWHLVEWVYNEYPAAACGHTRVSSFQPFVKSQCPSIGYLQDVANGTKHRAITTYVPTVKKTEAHQGAFSNAFSKGFGVSCLKLTLNGGKVVYFDEEVAKARAFWKNYFASTLGVHVARY